MKKYCLENEFLYAEISPHWGGMLSKLTSKIDKSPILKDITEDQHPWPHGGIPILFPFAGRTWHQGTVGHYSINDKIYELGIHGFIYKKSFEIVTIKPSKILLKYKSNESDLKLFPFPFTLYVEYELRKQSIHMKLDIINDGNEIMPIAPGLHPFFYCDFATEDSIHITAKKFFKVTSEGNLGESFMDQGECSSLSDKNLHNLIIANIPSSPAILIFHQKHIKIQSGLNCAFWVLWGKPEENFICVEPWVSVPDAIHRKKGLIEISPGENSQINFSIKISHPNLAS